MSPPKLLTRDAFREAVLIRDGHRCLFCDATEGLDAHHVLERRLWPDGGYYLDNGATVCAEHHLACERTLISCDEVRAAAKIARVVLPSHLEEDQDYDKWGNPILPNGTRFRGELFFEPSVQKVLAEGGVLHLFTHHVKYPRTWHLPWSPGVGSDDKVQHDLSALEGQEVVVTVKMDGENTTFYQDYLHARSLDYRSRIDRDRIRALHATVAADIPEEWRVCGENLWAEHSIRYERLPSLFLVFSIWNQRNECLSWDETAEWAALLGLATVPVLYRGPFDKVLLERLHEPEHDGQPCEGYVVRVAESFSYASFRRKVAKYVRKDHVQTDRHWSSAIRPNPCFERVRP